MQGTRSSIKEINEMDLWPTFSFLSGICIAHSLMLNLVSTDNVIRSTHLQFIILEIKRPSCCTDNTIGISIWYRVFHCPSTISFRLFESPTFPLTKLPVPSYIQRSFVVCCRLPKCWVCNICPIIFRNRFHENKCGHWSCSVPDRWSFSNKFLCHH